MSGMNLKSRAMNSEEIKQLLKRYYEGASTSEEEDLLKKFFSGEDIPDDLLDEREIFRYYIKSAVIQEPSSDFEERIISAIDNKYTYTEGIRRRKLYGILAGIAAVLLIVAGSYFFFTSRSEPLDTYTDPEIAYAETMKILLEVSASLNQGTKALVHLSALQDETQKTMVTVSKSVSVIKENMKPLDNLFEAIGKSDSN